MTKKHLGYLLGAVAGVAIAAPALLLGSDVAHAQPTDGFFGGATPDQFASTAGLGDADLPTTIASIINVMLGFLGVVAVVIILFGGFKWMTAAGNDDKVAEAKKLIISGIIGIIIILSAFAIAQFVLEKVSGAITSSTPPVDVIPDNP